MMHGPINIRNISSTDLSTVANHMGDILYNREFAFCQNYLNPTEPVMHSREAFMRHLMHRHCVTRFNTVLFEMIFGVLTTCHTPRSPDATPCDFFLWGYVKDQVYVPSLPASILELKVRIRTATETITADMLQTVWNELDYRADICRITKGAHIEHL